jgi:TetR/AcrR family transcriptional repressor of mexJK operon
MVELLDKYQELTPRSRAKHEQIIEAAQHLFLKDGFQNTSMEAIRLEAQVSKATLYNHFDSKENLFIGIAEHELDEMSKGWLPVLAEGVAIVSRERLHSVLFQFASAALDHLMAPKMIRLAHTLLAETRTFPELGTAFRERISQRVFRIVSSVLADALDQGVLAIERERIPLAARFFAAQMLSYLLIDGLLLGEEAAEKPAVEGIETMLDLYLRMIC